MREKCPLIRLSSIFTCSFFDQCHPFPYASNFVLHNSPSKKKPSLQVLAKNLLPSQQLFVHGFGSCFFLFLVQLMISAAPTQSMSLKSMHDEENTPFSNNLRMMEKLVEEARQVLSSSPEGSCLAFSFLLIKKI